MGKKEVIKWIFSTLFVVIGVLILIRLGIWQLNRLAERKAFNQHYIDQISAPTIQLNSDFVPNLTEMEYRSVEVRGYYDFSNEIFLQNQAWQNQPGYRVVTPLQIYGTDRSVFIDRGWIALDDKDNINQINANFSGLQEIKGIIRLSKSGSDFQSKSNPDENNKTDFFLNIDLSVLNQRINGDVLPVYVQIGEDNDDLKPYSELSEIEISEGPHMGYAIQWFFFASLLGLGYPFFVRKQLKDKKKENRE